MSIGALSFRQPDILPINKKSLSM